jgi:DNA (cytosine-5)-methyltransferase 1
VVAQFRFIDLFAGIGGIRLGFESEGGSCVFSSEWDKFAAQTYEKNYGESPHGDLTKIGLDEIPDYDLLLAGFPCQPFSHAGLKKGFDDTRGTLFFDIARIIESKKPRAVLLENVKGFAGHDKGNTFAVVRRILENLDYVVHWKILNAKDFGVPQNRERIYIVGLRSDLPNSSSFEFPVPPRTEVRVGDVLESHPDPKYTISDKLWEGHQRRLAEHRAKGNGFGYSLFTSESAYTSTISARYYKDGSEVLIAQEGKNPRKLTPREAARLQGFPETFEIPDSDNQAYKQFGNSVAVPVVKAIANRLAPFLRVAK